MNLQALFTDDQALSPAIGVTLMVAIAVSLAAILGAFVFGLHTPLTDVGPDAEFSFELTDRPNGHDTVTISHAGGDVLDGSNIDATVTGATTESGSPAPHDADHFSYPRVEPGDTSTLDASDFTFSGNLDLNGVTVRVVWESPENSRSATLATWSAPAA